MAVTRPADLGPPSGPAIEVGDADVILDAFDRLADTGPEFDGYLSNHGPMVVDALVHLGGAAEVAGWVDAYRPRLMPAPPAEQPIDPSEWREHLGDLRRVGDWALSSLDDFAAALDRWDAGRTADPLDDIVSTAARILANRTDGQIAFCHAVTAPAAIRMVIDELPDPLRWPSIATGWQLTAAIIAAFGFPAMPDELAPISATDCGPEPVELAARAIEHGDEHVIKLTEAAIRQFARTGDRVLLVAADRYRRRTEGP